MIADQDRSGWFGASDTSYVMGNWHTKTFKDWWLKKMGLNTGVTYILASSESG